MQAAVALQLCACEHAHCKVWTAARANHRLLRHVPIQIAVPSSCMTSASPLATLRDIGAAYSVSVWGDGLQLLAKSALTNQNHWQPDSAHPWQIKGS